MSDDLRARFIQETDEVIAELTDRVEGLREKLTDAEKALADAEALRQMLAEPVVPERAFAQRYAGTTPPKEKVRDWIRSVEEEFAGRDLAAAFGMSTSWGRDQIREFLKRGMIEEAIPRSGPRPAQYRFVKPTPEHRPVENGVTEESAPALPVAGTGKVKTGNVYLEKLLRKHAGQVTVERMGNDHFKIINRANGESFTTSSTPSVDTSDVLRSKLRGIGIET